MGLRISRLRVSTDQLSSPPLLSRPVLSCPDPSRPFHGLPPAPVLGRTPPDGAARTSPPAPPVPGHHLVPGRGEAEYPASRAESARPGGVSGGAGAAATCGATLRGRREIPRSPRWEVMGESSVHPAERTGGEHMLAGLPGARGSPLARGRLLPLMPTPASRLDGARRAGGCRVLPATAGRGGYARGTRGACPAEPTPSAAPFEKLPPRGRSAGFCHQRVFRARLVPASQGVRVTAPSHASATAGCCAPGAATCRWQHRGPPQAGCSERPPRWRLLRRCLSLLSF